MEDIFEEAIREALEESGVTLDNDVIENIAAWVYGCYDNRELCIGPVENPMIHQMDELERSHKRDIERMEQKEQEMREKIKDVRRAARRREEELRYRIDEIKEELTRRDI